MGILISKYFILQDISLYSVSGTYAAVGGVLIAIMAIMFFARMPEGSDSQWSAVNAEGVASWKRERSGNGQSSTVNSIRRLLSNRIYTGGIIAQFFYVGAQIGVWSFTIRLVMKELEMTEAEAATLYLISIVGFCSSRFIYTWLMKYIAPQRLLATGAVLSTICALVVVLTSGWLCVISLIFVSVFMSLMFPTIYGIALESVSKSKYSDDAKIGASGLIMSILGGALLTPLQGMVSDASNINISYLVPMGCFLAVLLFALSTKHPLKP